MHLENTSSKVDRAICSMVGVELNEKWISLSQDEVETLRQAQRICEKAQMLLEQSYNDPDLITAYGEADHALSDILKGG